MKNDKFDFVFKGLNSANLIRLALLCGSDYTRGVEQVGPVTALEILSEFNPTINNMDDSVLNQTIEHREFESSNGISDQMIRLLLKPLENFK